MQGVGSTLPRRRLGRLLRDLRHQTGITLEEAAHLIELSPSSLQRLETGQATRIRLVDIRELCRLYDADEVTAAGLLGLAQQATEKSWWNAYGGLIPPDFDVYVGLESAARQIFSYTPDAVLGLLQTPAYARVLARSVYPNDSDAEMDQRMELKLKRQAKLTRKRHPVRLSVVLLECALRRMVGSPRIMAAQLRHLADMSTRPNIDLRILTYRAGVPLGDPIGLFTILEFGTDNRGEVLEPPVVYLENFTGDLYLETPDDVQRYHEAHQAIRRAALDNVASRNFIRQIAKEFVA
ncbi:helix-turn-helix domain-containing protein [Nocardia thraciensis]